MLPLLGKTAHHVTSDLQSVFLAAQSTTNVGSYTNCRITAAAAAAAKKQLMKNLIE